MHISLPLDRVSPSLRLAAACLALLFLAGCGGGISSQVRDKAESIPKSIEKARQEVENSRKAFNTLRDGEPFSKQAKKSAKREDWPGYFTRANDALTRVGERFDKEMGPLLKANQPTQEPRVAGLTVKLSKEIKAALNLSRFPKERFLKLLETSKNMGPVLDTGLADATAIQKGVADIKDGPLKKVLADFPDAQKTIQNRFAPLSKLGTDAQMHAKQMQEIHKAHETGGAPDYGIFQDLADMLREDAAGLAKTREKFQSDVNQLYTGYTKILQDMKVQYYATIARESWDENADRYVPKISKFTREIGPAAFDALAASQLDSIAAVTAGYPRSRFVNNIGETWHQLDLNPVENWPPGSAGHNAAEFWIEGLSALYFHKYLMEENGETRETDWEKVNPSYFEQNQENLGMAILSKPYGVFEADALAQAAPPGMAYVGNPEYGEWKTDDNGNDFWSWYGKWMFFSNLFFMPPSYFYYNSWYDWDRHYRYKKPYYGKNKKGHKIYGTYGTYVKKSPRFQSTTFAKTGGFKRPPASVRGAGAGVRGGGPRGKGK